MNYRDYIYLESDQQLVNRASKIFKDILYTKAHKMSLIFRNTRIFLLANNIRVFFKDTITLSEM